MSIWKRANVATNADHLGCPSGLGLLPLAGEYLRIGRRRHRWTAWLPAT